MPPELTSATPEPSQPAEAPVETAAATPAAEPPGDVGCMIFLGLLIILVPFCFLFAYVVLGLLVALFFAWLVQMSIVERLLPKANPLKLLLVLWLVMIAAFFVIAAMLGHFST